MATNARNRRLEPAYKQHTVVDDLRGVILDVEVTTGEVNEGQVVIERSRCTMATTGADRDGHGGRRLRLRQGLRRARTAADRRPDPDQGRADPAAPCRCAASATMPGTTSSNARAARSCVPAADQPRPLLLRSCPGLCAVFAGEALPVQGPGQQGGRDRRRLPALLRARRRRERWSDDDERLYQRHRWRSEGFHGEAKTWHGLARAVRRGLANMRIQAFLTAAADHHASYASCSTALVHFMRNVFAHAGKSGRGGGVGVHRHRPRPGP